jgi:putative copper export protein
VTAAVVTGLGRAVVEAGGQAAGNVPSLSDALGGFRLILHALAATVWVGGQFTVAGLLPTIRTLGEDAPKKVARAFGRLLWPAYAVLVVTGFWNIGSLTVKDASSAWKTVLMVKIAVVVVAGVAVLLHQRAASKRATAVWGAIGALASVAALCLGVFLAG